MRLLDAAMRRLSLGRSDAATATIYAGKRRLTLAGTHRAYMRPLHGWQANGSMIASATANVPRNSLCLDIGAHVGVTAITLAVRRPDCRIIALEPMPGAAAYLRQNLQANRIENVTVVEAAAAAEPGEIALTDNGPWSTAAAGGVMCRAVRIGDITDESPAFIKIDAEGHEPDALAGAGRVLWGSLVLMEFNAWTLLDHHYDPLRFAEAIWECADIEAVFYREQRCAVPGAARDFLHTNLTRHACVSDLLFRLRKPLPSLGEMVGR